MRLAADHDLAVIGESEDGETVSIMAIDLCQDVVLIDVENAICRWDSGDSGPSCELPERPGAD
jgi:hypothetical protein